MCVYFIYIYLTPSPTPTAKEEAEPHWAEVVVDILLSLLSQPSRHIRQVCKTVFSSICPHVTATAITTILDVSGEHVQRS